MTAGEPGGPERRANYVYYFEVGMGGSSGHGVWKGHFHFQITSWRRFWSAALSVKNRVLVLGMHFIMKLFGKSRIYSRLEGSAAAGDAGIVTNFVRITRFGLALYTLHEQYVLHPDGRQVQVDSEERFGPMPFLFNETKHHPAEILKGGMESVYYMPLLGAQWTARYTVRTDREHIDSVMKCEWAQAEEVIDRER